MDWLLLTLLRYPKCFQALGGAILTTSSGLALLGWKLIRRVERVEDRTGVLVSLEQALQHVPLPIPTTTAGIAFAVGCAISGAMLVYLGRWAQKITR